MAIAIDIEKVTRRFESVTALDEVSLSINAGEFFTLLGPSGSGKSTLLKQLAGFDTPSAGRILFDREDITSLPANKRPSNTVFQDLALFPHMSVGQNVAYGLRVQRLGKPEISTRTAHALSLVGLEGFEERDVNLLSGGQRQRVALARALIMEPGVLLLDEPLTGLDENLRQQMRDEFARLHDRTGATFVLVTHNQDEALLLSDRMAILRDGKVTQVAASQTFFEHPANRFIAQFMGMKCTVQPDTVEAREGGAMVSVGGERVFATLSKSDTRAPSKDTHVLVFRPNQAVLLGADDSRTDAVMLTMSALRYRGLFFDIHAVFPDGQEIIISHDASSSAGLPEIGAHIRVGFTTGAPLLLRDD